MQMMIQEQQFEKDYDRFIGSGAFLYVAKDSAGKWSLCEALERLRQYAQLYINKLNGGNSSLSAFAIVRDELIADKDPAVRIVPIFKDGELEKEAPELTAEQYHSMPSRQIQIKYRSDPAFKAQVEKLISNGLI
jgi:hypothetical protein